VAPSPIPCPISINLPRELTVEEIGEIEDLFAQAALRAKEAGIDTVELHGAHGYLMAQFMSRYSNTRTDAYGGDLAGFLRFPLNVIQKVRKKVGPDYPIIFRLSADEKVPGGRGLQESKVMAKYLEQAGVDALHVSAAVYGSVRFTVPPMSVPPGINVEAAAEIKKVTSVPVIAVGRIHDPYMAEGFLEQGFADLIALGRPSIADEDYPKKVSGADGGLEDLRCCISCNQGCISRVFMGQPVSCLVNPAAGREEEMALVMADQPKIVLIIGGGPGGMEAARVAALRGHEVHLYEKESRLGGQLNLASMAPCKQEFAKVVRYLSTQVKKTGVNLHLNTEATRETVSQIKPDVIIIATGSVPLRPNIPGLDQTNVATAWDVLKGEARPGRNSLIIGGGLVGAETADFLAQFRGRKVTLVEMLPDIAGDMGGDSRHFLLERLKEKGVAIITGAEVKRVQDDSVILACNGQEQCISGFDVFVLALGSRPQDDVALELKDTVEADHIFLIGDVKEPRKAIDAIREGAETARLI